MKTDFTALSTVVRSLEEMVVETNEERPPPSPTDAAQLLKRIARAQRQVPWIRDIFFRRENVGECMTWLANHAGNK